jgi:hypothetical protein
MHYLPKGYLGTIYAEVKSKDSEKRAIIGN